MFAAHVRQCSEPYCVRFGNAVEPIAHSGTSAGCARMSSQALPSVKRFFTAEGEEVACSESIEWRRMPIRILWRFAMQRLCSRRAGSPSSQPRPCTAWASPSQRTLARRTCRTRPPATRASSRSSSAMCAKPCPGSSPGWTRLTALASTSRPKPTASPKRFGRAPSRSS